MAYAGGEKNIFHEMVTVAAMGLLWVSGIWDLEKKEIPCILVYGIAALALLVFLESSLWKQIYGIVMLVLFGGVGRMLVQSGKMGGGDVWILICFALIWPVNIFWKSLCNAVLILGIVSVGVWTMSGDEKVEIPMLPFLALGYWI